MIKLALRSDVGAGEVFKADCLLEISNVHFSSNISQNTRKYQQKKHESISDINFGGGEVFKADCLLKTNPTFLGQDLTHVSQFEMVIISNL